MALEHRQHRLAAGRGPAAERRGDLVAEISFFAFSAKVGQSDAPSSMTGSIFLPSTPPAALISSIASSSASLTETSQIAIVPLSECRMPTLIVSPLGVPPEVDAEVVSSLSPQPAMPNASATPAHGDPATPGPPQGWDDS